MKRVRLGPQGRAVIPAEFRHRLELTDGSELVAWLEGDRLVFRRREDVERELWTMFDEVPVSLSEELVAERRLEAAREG